MLAWIPLLPLLGFIVNITLARKLSRKVIGAIASLAMLAAFVVANCYSTSLGLPARLDAELSDRRPLVDRGDAGVDAKGCQRLDDELRPGLVVQRAHLNLCGFGEKIKRRKLPAVSRGAAYGELSLVRFQSLVRRGGDDDSVFHLIAFTKLLTP